MIDSRPTEFFQLPMIVVVDSGSTFDSFDALYRATAAIRKHLLSIVPYYVGLHRKPIYHITTDNQPEEPEVCVMVLAGEVEDMLVAYKRSRWIVGRIYNRLCGFTPDYISVTGKVLAGIYRFLEEPLPPEFERGFKYLLRADHAERLNAQSTCKARTVGMIK
ncbi:hypothetical protein [Halocynthiibacter namhaensis]|uniref:hypothetical protein n=1 Tax=Halocynthiibacter namhaensis TaxID=1290553 RepID=UPI00057922DA|nr:hypothetical protein [Halocynthiibacter namhaensis]